MESKNIQVGVLGGGSWGTALVKLLSGRPENVHWWIRSEKTIRHLQAHGRNPNYLPHAELPENIHKSTDINEIIAASDLIILAIPSAFLKDAVRQVKISHMRDKMFFSAIKGIIPGEVSTVSELLEKHYGIPRAHLGVIAGPCHSEEVVMEKHSFLTIGAYSTKLAETLKELLSAWFMKINISDDVLGIEYASVLKNIIAIAAGMTLGLGYGDNYRAVVISNGIHEMSKFLRSIECNGRDISKSVYLGDVMVTAYSKFSRNRMFGNMIGKGYSLKAILTEMKMVAEGYYAVDSIMKVAMQKDLELPVTRAVYNVLYEQKDIEEEFQRLSGFLT